MATIVQFESNGRRTTINVEAITYVYRAVDHGGSIYFSSGQNALNISDEAILDQIETAMVLADRRSGDIAVALDVIANSLDKGDSKG